MAELIAMAQEIDTGANAESIYMSIAGTKLRKEACHFSLNPKINKDIIYKDLVKFQKELIKAVEQYIKNLPLPPLGELFRILR